VSESRVGPRGPASTVLSWVIVFTKLENVHYSKDSTYTVGTKTTAISYKQQIE
jgi:hypothetical protein